MTGILTLGSEERGQGLLGQEVQETGSATQSIQASFESTADFWVTLVENLLA